MFLNCWRNEENWMYSFLNYQWFGIATGNHDATGVFNCCCPTVTDIHAFALFHTAWDPSCCRCFFCCWPNLHQSSCPFQAVAGTLMLWLFLLLLALLLLASASIIMPLFMLLLTFTLLQVFLLLLTILLLTTLHLPPPMPGKVFWSLLCISPCQNSLLNPGDFFLYPIPEKSCLWSETSPHLRSWGPDFSGMGECKKVSIQGPGDFSGTW